MARETRIADLILPRHTFSFSFPTEYDTSDSKIVGVGTFAVIATCVDMRSAESVAVKRYDLDILENTDQDQNDRVKAWLRLLREVVFLKHIRHEYIVRMHDVYWGPEGSLHVVISPSLDTDLGSVLKNGRKGGWTLDHTRVVLFQVLLAIAFMHEQQILHRDLNSRNVLVDRGGKACVCDLGLAKYDPPDWEWRNLPIDKALPCYWASPEVLLDSKRFSFASDMWSFGTILWECLFTVSRGFVLKSTQDKPSQLSLSMHETPENNPISWPEEVNSERQLRAVAQLIGSPSESDASSLGASLQLRAIFRDRLISPAPLSFAEMLPGVDSDSLDLLRNLLKYAPNQRITAKQALQHPFFTPVSEIASRISSETREVIHHDWKQVFHFELENLAGAHHESVFGTEQNVEERIARIRSLVENETS